MKTQRILVPLAAAVLSLPGLLSAQTVTSAVPGFISYQGKILDAGGAAVGTPTPVNRTVIFRIWDHSSNTLTGNLIYSEQQTVTISGGEFSVLVGQGAATSINTFGYSETAKGPPGNKLADAFNGSTRYLGVTVAAGPTIALTDNEITPRQQIVSSGYAVRAKYAETLGTGASTALTVLDNGNTGIGNPNPTARLMVGAAGTGTLNPQFIVTADDVTERLRFGVDSTGTGTGYIQSFKEGTGAQNLLLNPNGGNVGIGMTGAPNAALDVNGGIKASGALGYTFNTGDLDGGLFSPSDGVVILKTNNTERLRVDAAGNLVLSGNATLPTTNGSGSAGVLTVGTSRIHSYGNYTFFAGDSAGNFTSTGDRNTGIGYYAMNFNTSGVSNSAVGMYALRNNTTGSYNTAVGEQGLYSNTTGASSSAFGYLSLYANTSGYNNAAFGAQSLLSNSTGTSNAAFGYQSLYSNTTGSNNSSFGSTALDANTTGSENTAGGFGALGANTTGLYNTGFGVRALQNNTTGQFNTAIGREALATSTTAGETTAVGAYALYNMTTGVRNTAIGVSALTLTTTGDSNTAVGYKVLDSNTTGDRNTASGYLSLDQNSTGTANNAYGYYALNGNTTGGYNTGVGPFAVYLNTTGSYNTGIGYNAGPSAGGYTNTTCLGADAQATANNMIVLGNTNVTSLRCKVGLTVTSDRNLKENFEPVDGAEVVKKILAMPLTSWNYIGDDKTTFRHYGPMAQDFYAAFGRDAVGTIGNDTTINSGDLSGVMLSAIQELARKLEARDAEVEALQEANAGMAALQDRLDALEAKDKARDAKLVAIEKLLDAAAEPVVIRLGDTANQ